MAAWMMEPKMRCLGCRDDLTDRGTDKKDLKNADSVLVQFWQELFVAKVATMCGILPASV